MVVTNAISVYQNYVYHFTHPLLIVNSTLIDYWNGLNTTIVIFNLTDTNGISFFRLSSHPVSSIVNLALINYWYCCIQQCLPLLYNWLLDHLIVTNAIRVYQVLIPPIHFWSLTRPLSITEIAVHNRGLPLIMKSFICY